MPIQYSITQNPEFALITVQLEAGQKIYSEPGAMASMDDNIKLTADLQGGLMGSIQRGLGGESLIISTYEAEGKPGELVLAAGQPGDTVHYSLDGTCSLLLQRGSYLAHSDGVTVSSSWQGVRGFFSGEGLILLQVTGSGDLFFNSFGAIIEIDVEDELFIDTGFIVAFESTLNYNVTTLPGLRPGTNWKSLFLGGEGLVCKFTGKGKVWIQSRQISTFLRWVHPFRPVESSN
jgi:uncharacterized protein (TIGR00266 family)